MNRKEIVETIVSWGYNVLIVENDVFTFTKFTPADDNTLKHYLKGQDITAVISETGLFANLNFGNTDNAKGAFITKLETVKTVQKEYSNLYRWHLYLSA